MTEPLPVTAMLAKVWVAFTIDVDNAFEAASASWPGKRFQVSLPMWANGLRWIDEDGTTVADLRTRARAACNLAGLERWGWLHIGDPGGGRRPGFGSHRGVTSGTVLRPTRAGRAARGLWPRLADEAEQRWLSRFGAAAIGGLRKALVPFAADMPSAPPEVHPPDGFRSHVVDGPARDPESTLAGLLGQALTRVTVDAEHGSAVSLPLAANLLRVIGDTAVHLRDLPARSGVSKEAVSMATGFLERHQLAESAPGRLVTLTASGHAALAGYQARTAGAGAGGEALRTALGAVLAQPDALAAGLAPPEGCWRGERPYLTQTQRLLADPVAALPWQPMVLHRGGWPDGS